MEYIELSKNLLKLLRIPKNVKLEIEELLKFYKVFLKQEKIKNKKFVLIVRKYIKEFNGIFYRLYENDLMYTDGICVEKCLKKSQEEIVKMYIIKDFSKIITCSKVILPNGKIAFKIDIYKRYEG